MGHSCWRCDHGPQGSSVVCVTVATCMIRPVVCGALLTMSTAVLCRQRTGVAHAAETDMPCGLLLVSLGGGGLAAAVTSCTALSRQTKRCSGPLLLHSAVPAADRSAARLCLQPAGMPHRHCVLHGGHCLASRIHPHHQAVLAGVVMMSFCRWQENDSPFA